MKLAIVSNRPDSAIDHVLRPVAHALKADLIYNAIEAGFDPEPYDIVHVGWLGSVTGAQLASSSLITANLWNLAVSRLKHINPTNDAMQFVDRYVVDDTTTLQSLGQLGFTNVTMIPLAFEHEQFTPLPPPDAPFTVGVFGNDYPSKRFEVVIEACRLAGVRCYAQILGRYRSQYNLDPIRDVYEHIHAFVHPSLTDTNSMTGYEALLCGRPLISTHSFGVHRFLIDGLNGLFFDGSVCDLVEKIKILRDDYAAFRQRTHATVKPPLKEAIDAYRRMFERLYAEDD